jgi:hypothetical protein
MLRSVIPDEIVMEFRQWQILVARKIPAHCWRTTSADMKNSVLRGEQSPEWRIRLLACSPLCSPPRNDALRDEHESGANLLARHFEAATHARWDHFLAPTLGMLVTPAVFLLAHGGISECCAKIHHANDGISCHST